VEFFLIFLLILFLFCSAFFSASETALFSLSSMKVRAFSEQEDHNKQLIASLLSRPRELLVTIIILNISVNIFIQNIASSLFGDSSSWLLNVGLPLCLVLIFGEILPKSIALVHNTRVAIIAAPIINGAKKAIFPIRQFLIRATPILTRFLFFFLKKEKEISIDELQHTLRESRQFGVLHEDEAELIRGYLKLEESSVKELMRPREEVIDYDTDEPLSRLIHLFVDQECSRIPICQKGLDNLLGIMTSRLFFLHRNALHSATDLLPILKKPFFVPESMPAKTLLRQFYERKETLAVVVDEYSSICGLITLEDLVETVVGEIVDRRDEKSRYTRSGEDVIIASGKLELAELEEIFNIALKSENNMVTIGGWLTEKLGDIPKSGTKYVSGQLIFHVLSADPNRVRRVYIRHLKKTAQKKKKR